MIHELTVHESPVLVARRSGGGAHVWIDPSCGLHERVQVSRMTKGDVADCDTVGEFEQRMRKRARKLWKDGAKRTGPDCFRFDFAKAILPLDLQRDLHMFEVRLPRHKNSMDPRRLRRVLFESKDHEISSDGEVVAPVRKLNEGKKVVDVLPRSHGKCCKNPTPGKLSPVPTYEGEVPQDTLVVCCAMVWSSVQGDASDEAHHPVDYLRREVGTSSWHLGGSNST